MPGAYLYGWEQTGPDTGIWHKLICNNEGKLIIDPSEIFENDPTDNEHGKAPDSDWAYEHAADLVIHHVKYTEAEAEDVADARILIHEADAVAHQDAPDLILAHKGDVNAHHTPPLAGDFLHNNLGGIGPNDHHTAYTDAEAEDVADARILIHEADAIAHQNAPALITAHEAKVNVKVGLFSRDTGLMSGTQVITGVGFRPSCIDFKAVISLKSCVSMGFDDVITHNCVFSHHQVIAGSWLGNASRSVHMEWLGGESYEGKVDSFNSDGFVFRWYKNSSNIGVVVVYYKARRY
ncbi:hypothetical protein ES708_29611 [subsurface metagenome]